MARIIVAYSVHGRIIGDQGQLPWHLPGDMQRFRELTQGDVVIMGRKTYESIPERFRPLPGRHNVVLTRDPEWRGHADVFHDLTAALSHYPDAWIIGGGEIYQEALPLVEEVIATEVEGNYQGDASFPPLNHEEWQRTVLCHSLDEGWMQVSFRRRQPS